MSDNLTQKDILPSDYWKRIKDINPNIIINKNKGLVLATIIPVFGESHYIERTLKNLTVFQRNNLSKKNLIITVVKKLNLRDKTCIIIKRFLREHPKESILLIEEETLPGKTCIGHARAIGFGIAICLAEQNKIPLSNLILSSTDADIIEIDPLYISKVRQSFLNPSTHVVSCENRFSKRAMKYDYIRLLKVVDDGFFFNQFETIGALNGRCYSVRANKYISSGGVDYTAQFDDISFGIKVHKNVGKESFCWIPSYVVSSERRYAEAIKRESLMSGYQDPIAIGNRGCAYIKDIPIDKKKLFYINHINEGFNVLLYYYSKRFSNEKTHEDDLLSQFQKYIKYINDSLPFVKVKNFNSKQVINLYRKYSAHEIPNKWWKKELSFEIDLL